jgi:5-methylcytosine-specific restriction endonuclease McrA
VAHDGGLRAFECRQAFGFSKAAWGDAIRRGDLVPRSHLIPLTELLVSGRSTKRGHLKSRLLKAGIKQNRCEEFGLTEWRGRPLAMQLHHSNGDGRDNRLENLTLLCPNCHAQTPTYAGRNGHRRRGPGEGAGARGSVDASAGVAPLAQVDHDPDREDDQSHDEESDLLAAPGPVSDPERVREDRNQGGQGTERGDDQSSLL